jgi:multicomponent Na+:H+ antiporter subunit E
MNTRTHGRIRQQLEVFVVLLLIWILLNGSLAPDSLAVGAGISLLIALFSRRGMTFLSDFHFSSKAALATVGYFLYFFQELVKANIRLAKIVLSPSLPINPGFVKVRTRLKSRMGRLALANTITLTPGTLTVEMKDDWLYVHWITMDASDIDGATEQIVSGFERYLEVMYG